MAFDTAAALAKIVYDEHRWPKGSYNYDDGFDPNADMLRDGDYVSRRAVMSDHNSVCDVTIRLGPKRIGGRRGVQWDVDQCSPRRPWDDGEDTNVLKAVRMASEALKLCMDDLRRYKPDKVFVRW